MYHLNLLCFLVISLTSCYAGDEQGVVLDFAPSGDFTYIFSKHESEQLIVDWWLKKDGKEFVRFLCTKIELNANTDNVITQYRASILITGNIELESFEVIECDKDKLLASIIVTQTLEEKHKKGYQIVFKDTDRGCRSRLYQVEIIPNQGDSVVTITRDPPTILGSGYRSIKCPIAKNVKGLVFDWFEDGKHHDLVLFDEYDPIIRFGGDKCDGCWILCTETRKNPTDSKTPETLAQIQASVPEEEKVRFVDVLIADTPVDRIKVTSCSAFSLKTSFKFDYQGKVDNRVMGVYINYLKTDGTCYYRKYKYDVQLHKNIMLKNIFVTREDVVLNRDCKTMKALGMLRGFVNKAKRHLGRVTNHLISWKRQDDDE